MKKIALFLSAVLALSAVFAAVPASAVNTEKIEGALYEDESVDAASAQDPTQNGIEIAGLPQNEYRLLEGDLVVLLRPMTGDEFTAACPDLIPYRCEYTFHPIPPETSEPYPVYPVVRTRSVGSDPIATEDRVRSAEDDPEGPDPLLGIALLGDLNCDGKVQASDARLVLWCAAGLTQFGKRAPETETLANVGYEFLIAAADTDFDGKIKSRDARAVLRAAAKIEPFVPGM